MIDIGKLFTLGFNSRTTNILKRTITNRDFISMFLVASDAPQTRRDVLTALYRFRGFDDPQDRLNRSWCSSYLSTTIFGGHCGTRMDEPDRHEYTSFYDDRPDEARAYTREILWFRCAPNLYSPTFKGFRHAARIITGMGLDRE